MLTIKRNDPCHCGSRKKYKKCCLSKASINHIQEVKEEQFFQQKQAFVLTLREFINTKLPRVAYYQLEAEFKRRSQHSINEKLEKGFFEFWLFFFHRFENGLRGIEWFNTEKRNSLAKDAKEMADTWQKLTPKVVQAVNNESGIITFEDVFTNEHYQVKHLKDNVPSFNPWYGTITLLEAFKDTYYFNGVRLFEDPSGVNRAIKKVQELVATTNLGHEQVLFDYYPEILAALVVNDKEDHESRSIDEYILEYKVEDAQELLAFVQNVEAFEIDEWDDSNKQCSWAGRWYLYTDNQLQGPIHLAEVYGKFTVKDDLLVFNSLEQARMEEFQQLIQGLLDTNALSFIDKKTNSFSIPASAEIRDMMVTFDKDTPQYFALYAQSDVRFEFDKPIRQFDGLSIKELIANNRVDDADHWLKQIEYNLYQQVKQQYKNIEITADFNSVRKELGLPLSLFVTGGENRETTFTLISTPYGENSAVVNETDIPFYEQLGFTPDTTANFYAKDLVAFFKEKTAGKSENTVRKYRNSLNDLRVILEMHSLVNWEACDQVFWTTVFTKNFTDLYEILSKTAIKDFISTTKALVKWLDQEHKTAIAKVLTQVVKETEEDLLGSLVVHSY